ncbi:DUF294 nucleotidyltransferase-like domain-containing protein [Shewanella submarina]|uniref:DUF294 nucleotidyltransferase-like domain-containing protein n=1 Tax=Shewanella submarina TaxID=2016376 RepID=A0ABV7GG71_9GAMM|nr:DUF294 nucleotidyltransferase-like domain-containing protein [Shewanella submarina]MCL1036573.1 DUF294 nucleotidyltransferase-like domain-containing protein [Shewanella submarina]
MDSSELQPILDFVNGLVPFNQLQPESLEWAARQLEIVYFPAASHIVPLSDDDRRLYIVRSGAFEVRDKEGELVDRLGEGDYFGYPSLLSGDEISNSVKVLEDGLVYQLPEECFSELCSANREFSRFFNRAYARRMRHEGRFKARSMLTTSRLSSLMSSDPITIDIDQLVGEAARLMSQHRVSSVLVQEGEHLVGILTDRDLRSRVLAEDKGPFTRIADVMTTSPLTVEPETLVFEATVLMGEHNVHHLPVTRNGKPVGMVTSTDILRSQSSQPLLMMGEIDRQTHIEGLINLSKRIPMLLQNLISADARAEEIGRILTSVTDALTRRLIELAQSQLGEAPMDFCWLAFGSQGRQDQVACSDQDNGMLLAREPDSQEAEYFSQLAKIVCDGLDACGYIYCPGDIMAMNPKWRMSLKEWQQRFSSWVNSPEPKALMHASIFFDMRAIYGPERLFDGLQLSVLELTRDNDIFLALLTGNAMNSRPPLGFFRQFVLERDGSEVKGIDLKHKGSAIINDIARVYALSAGVREINTPKRIRQLVELGVINRKDALNLADAQEFIAHMRLANQGRQFEEGQKPDNYLKPGAVSSLVRHQLKEAFKVVDDAQSGIRLRFMRAY